MSAWRRSATHLVVAVADVGGGDEQLEGIFLSIVALDLSVLLDLLHPLLAVTSLRVSSKGEMRYLVKPSSFL